MTNVDANVTERILSVVESLKIETQMMLFYAFTDTKN